MANFLRMLVGVALLPACWGVARAFFDAVLAAGDAEGVSPEALSLLGGIAAFALCWLALSHPVRAYVLGHELTHAIWGVAFGARPSKLRVSGSGGSVNLTKTNMLITLAPYFFPFWTIIVVVAALVTRCFVSPLPWPCAWLFAIAFTWCFHVCFTIRSLMQPQPDVQEYGRLFSYVLIWTFNVAGVIVWIACTTEVTWRSVGECLWARTSGAYLAIASLCASLAARQ